MSVSRRDDRTRVLALRARSLEWPCELRYPSKGGRSGVTWSADTSSASTGLDPHVCGMCGLTHYPHALVQGPELPMTVVGTSCFQELRRWDELVEVITVAAWSSS